MEINSFTGTTAVSDSAHCHLEGDKSRFQRMQSVDSFNQVGGFCQKIHLKFMAIDLGKFRKTF